MWQATTPAPAEKHGAIIASTLPNSSKKYKEDLHDKFFEQVDRDKLITSEGLDIMIKFLQKELGEQDLGKIVRVWEEFKDCVGRSKRIEVFVLEFERAYNNVTVTSKTAVLPAEVRAFMLLRRSGLNSTQRMLVLSQLDHERVEDMFENMAEILKVVVGSGPGGAGMREGSSIEPIKFEADSSEEGVFIASDGTRYVKKSNFYNRGRGFQGGSGTSNSRKPYEHKPRENKKDANGKITRCRMCELKYLYQKHCKIFKDLNEKKKSEDVNVMEVSEEEIDFALSTELQEDLSEFTLEVKHCAALDSCCTSSVAGEVWLNLYEEELKNKHHSSEIKGPVSSNRVFRFGNSWKLPSLGKYVIPAFLAGKRGTLEIDIVNSNIPLLLSMKAMKKAEMKIDIVEDTAEIFG